MSKRFTVHAGVMRALVAGVACGLTVAWLFHFVLPRTPWEFDRWLGGENAAGRERLGPQLAERPVWEVIDEGRSSAIEAAVGHNNAGVALARNREWPRAAEHLRAALRSDPHNASIRTNLQQVLLAWGVDEFHDGTLASAFELFGEASELRADPEVEYWLGRAWWEKGEPTRARTVWEKALQQFPEHPRLLLALADFWEQRDDRPRALEYLVQARAAGIDSAALLQKIERLSREVDAEWDYFTTRSARFDFRHPAFDDPTVLDLIISSFENAYDALLQRLGAGPTAPVRVVLYPLADFYAVTRSPDWAGGVYTGRIQLPVGGLGESSRSQLERVARHELAHALITEWSGSRAPAWLQEGLAMWCEDDHPGERWRWAKELTARHGGTSLDALPQSFSTLEKQVAEAAYATSYLAVVSLEERYGIRRLLSFMRLAAEHSWRDAFVGEFGQSFEDFAASLG